MQPFGPGPAYEYVSETVRLVPTGTSFGWRILLLCGDPEQIDTTYFAGFPKEQVSPISCPDNVAFDSEPDHLWISTDGAPGTLGTCDGMFLMPTDGPDKGKVQQFLSVPAGAECCGPVVEWTDRSVLICVQHPGDGLPSSYPYQPELRVFDPDPADASYAGDLVGYADLAPRLNELMASSDRVSVQVVGQSTNGRDLYLVGASRGAMQGTIAMRRRIRWFGIRRWLAVGKRPAAMRRISR